MVNKMFIEVVNDLQIAKFQVRYVSYTSLNQNRVFRDQNEKYIGLTFDKNTMIPVRITLKKNNTRILSLLMFYSILIQ